MDYAELGRRIRLAREEVFLSQEIVAKHLGLPRSAISLIEAGKRKIDSLELRTFSDLVGKNILFFLEENSIAEQTARTSEENFDSESSNTKDALKVDSTKDIDEDDSTKILFSANQVVDISQDREQIECFQLFCRNFAKLTQITGRQQDRYQTEPFYNIFKPTPAAARWMAAKERDRLGLPSTSPVRDMRSILESQGVRVMAWPLKTPKLGGCFLFSRLLGSFVLVKSNIRGRSTNMLNFVLAHEYCHYLIHRQLKGITCDPSGNYRRPEEYFAQWFAANFLMPEEALLPSLITYLKKSEGVITAEIVMHLAIDFGVSYTAMLNRMASKGVELIDKNTYKQFSQEKPEKLQEIIGRSVTPIVLPKKYPQDYEDMALEAYFKGRLELDRLAEFLEISTEEALSKIREKNLAIDKEWEE